MYLKFFHNASRKGAVIVYAMVFSMAAAAALYVGSSVFNARIQGDAISEYGRQRVFLKKTFEHVLFDAMRLSYEAGYGISGSNMWYSYTGSAYQLTSGGFTNEEKARYYPQEAINLFASYINGSKSDSTNWKSIYKWKMVTVDADEYIKPNNILYTNSDDKDFYISEFLTIPGWRPLRKGGNTITDTGEEYQNFIRISSSAFPYGLIQRKDLPFNQSKGWARATRTRYKYSLAGDETEIVGRSSMDIWSEPIWLVEEPVTNYQLVLLDKASNGSWPSSNSGTIVLKNSGSQGGNVAKMMAVGSIDQSAGEGSFQKETVGYAQEQAPVAFLLGADNFKEENETGMEVRYSHRSTFVGLGAGSSPSTAIHSILSPKIDNSLKELRKKEIWNAQAMISPSPLYPGDHSGSLNAWTNPVIYIDVEGSTTPQTATVCWTRQNTTGVPVDFGTPQSINPLTTSAAAVSLQARKNAADAFTNHVIPGLTVYVWNDSGIKKTIVRIDLATFDPASIASLEDSPANSDGYEWSAPYEIQIKGAWGVSILGATTPDLAINETPVKIVTDSTTITLKEDTNYRRFMLVSVPTIPQGSNTTSIPSAQIYFQPTSANPTWYGTLLAAEGAQIYSTRSTANWYGTIVSVKEFSLESRNFSLKIAPDDGAGLIGAGAFNHSGAQHNLFCPKYGATPMGNPVPLRAPSLMWILK